MLPEIYIAWSEEPIISPPIDMPTPEELKTFPVTSIPYPSAVMLLAYIPAPFAD